MKKSTFVLAIALSLVFVFAFASVASAQIKVRVCEPSNDGTGGGGGGGGGTNVTDNFDRANNSSLGVNWTTASGEFSPQIISNQSSTVAGGSRSVSYYSNATFAANQYAQIVFEGTLSGHAGACVRVQSATSDRYCVEVQGSVVVLMKYISDVPTQIGSTSFTPPATGDVYRLEISGTSLQVKKNGSPVSGLSGTDSALSSGKPGITLSGTSSNLDNFAAGDL